MQLLRRQPTMTRRPRAPRHNSVPRTGASSSYLSGLVTDTGTTLNSSSGQERLALRGLAPHNSVGSAGTGGHSQWAAPASSTNDSVGTHTRPGNQWSLEIPVPELGTDQLRRILIRPRPAPSRAAGADGTVQRALTVRRKATDCLALGTPIDTRPLYKSPNAQPISDCSNLHI